MKRRYPMPISEIIDQAFEMVGASDTMRAQRLCGFWPEIVGQGVNRLTTKRFVQDKILHVYINSAVIKNELMFQRQPLIDALNKAVGGDPVITDIQFH